LALAADVEVRGCSREIERHRCMAAWIERLLTQLGLDLSTQR
jgi:hypothetical protein